MKLLKNQYQDIIRVLGHYSIDQNKFSLVKKHGRIKIQIEDVESYFEFFRRRSVSLTAEDHQWEKSEHYGLNVEGKSSIVPDWDKVVQELAAWISRGKKNY